MNIKQGDIYLAQCHSGKASHIIRGYRPVIIVRVVDNSTVLHTIPLTTNMKKRTSRLHIRIEGHGLAQPSIALIEQVRLIDRRLLGKRLGTIAGTKEIDHIIQCLVCYFDPRAA